MDKKISQGMFRNISNPSIKNEGNNNSSATYPSFGGSQTKFKYSFGKNNINDNNSTIELNPFKNNSKNENDSNKNIDYKTKQKIQKKLQGLDNNSNNNNEEEITIINKGNNGRFDSMKNIFINNKKRNYKESFSSEIDNEKYNKNISQDSFEKEENNDNIKNKKNKKYKNKNNKEEEDSIDENNKDVNNNNKDSKNNKKNYKYITPNNILISPTSNNEIKYNIKNDNLNIRNNDSKEEEDEQSRRINRLINSIKTNQNTIRKSYGMIDLKFNDSKNNTNIYNTKGGGSKKTNYDNNYGYIRNSEENKNLYYNNTYGSNVNSIEINKYTLMYFCYLISHYMKRKVFVEYAKKIANYQIFLEKKFALKILYRVVKKRIIFYKIKFLHRYKKIYKYLYKNNIDAISQIYSEESSCFIYDSEKNNKKINIKNNKVENRNKLLEEKNKNFSKGKKKVNTKLKKDIKGKIEKIKK